MEVSWKGLVEIIHNTGKGKLHLQNSDAEELMKGWHSDKVRPYVLHEGSMMGVRRDEYDVDEEDGGEDAGGEYDGE
jgi:hypothetical protein